MKKKVFGGDGDGVWCGGDWVIVRCEVIVSDVF